MDKLTNYRILAIDPGTHHTGTAIIDLSVTNTIHVPFVETIHIDALLNRYQDVTHVHGIRYASHIAIATQIKHLLEQYQPNIVVSEAPYYSAYLEAYAALVELINIIRHTVYQHDTSMSFKTIDAASVKMNMGVKGNSGDKSLMREKLLAYPLSYESYLVPSLFDEHSVDSLCVGLTWCNRLDLD